jgi:hypothetical protein
VGLTSLPLTNSDVWKPRKRAEAPYKKKKKMKKKKEEEEDEEDEEEDNL